MTKLNYLNNTYLFEAEAILLKIDENEKGISFVLDETIFYPQGGGQPADSGKIISDAAVFTVVDVRLDEKGDVWHYGEISSGTFQKGDRLLLKLDIEKRRMNARLHSAGHLLDCAVEKIGITNLVPTKGFHFPEGPYVEYEGVLEKTPALILELETTINELIAQNIIVESKSLTQEMAKVQGIWAPPGKGARIVNFKGFPYCGCGGTHVNSAKEIGKVIVRKIKSKKGKTRIAYSLEN